MRFIRREKIVTTMFDKEIKDNETLDIVFRNLLDHKVEFSCIIRKYFDSEYNYRKIEYEKVRIKNFNEEARTLDLMIFNGSSVTTMNNINYSSIEEVNATTTKNKIIDTVEDITRGDLLDI